MKKEEDYWNYSEKDLIELMGQTGAGDNFVFYLSNILQHKNTKKITLNTKRLVLATWGLVIITGLLVLVTIFR
jgi:hypothetical protein